MERLIETTKKLEIQYAEIENSLKEWEREFESVLDRERQKNKERMKDMMAALKKQEMKVVALMEAANSEEFSQVVPILYQKSPKLTGRCDDETSDQTPSPVVDVDQDSRSLVAELKNYFDMAVAYPFSGLDQFNKYLESLFTSSCSDDIFCRTQSDPQLGVQVVPFLFENWLGKEDGLVDDQDLALALHIFHLCCFYDAGSKELAWHHAACQILTSMIPTRGINVQTACLNALIVLMTDSIPNQQAFMACKGMETIIALMSDEQVSSISKWHYGKFMLRLIVRVNGPQQPRPEVTSDNIRVVQLNPSSFRWAYSAEHPYISHEGSLHCSMTWMT